MRLLFVCLFVGVLRLPWFRFKRKWSQAKLPSSRSLNSRRESFLSRRRCLSISSLILRASLASGLRQQAPSELRIIPPAEEEHKLTSHGVGYTGGGKAHSMFESMFLVYANWLTVTVYVGVSVCVCVCFQHLLPPSPESRNLSWVWGSKVVFLSAVCHRDASIAAGKD